MWEGVVERPSLLRWFGTLIVFVTIGVARCAIAGPITLPIDPADFTTFADQQINSAIAHGDFPGAAVVLVEDGRVVVEKGYGVTSLESHQPVDPQQTRFRMGSISKIFTTVAVLQLVDRGQISLDDPIQKFLPDLPLGAAGDGVLVRHLLTHTDGFDVGWCIDAATIEPAPAPSLIQFLRTRLPPRIQPPGQMYVYSDVGMALAGHIVENVSGKPFEQDVQDEIFSPLAMPHSTFFQPPPGGDGAKLAQGYRRFRGQYHAVPLEHVMAVSAAAMTTTADDMARFMLAYLNTGELDGHRILQSQTALMMQQQQFTHHPAPLGTSFGFYERFENGQRALQHGGVLPGFQSQFIFIPSQNLGFFITTNAYGGANFDDFDHGFFDRFFAKPQASTQPASVLKPIPSDRANLSGRYRYVQYPHHDLGKVCIFAGLVEEMRVRQQPDGSILVDQGLKGPFQHIGPLLYARGEEKIAFRVDANGNAIGAAYDTWAFEKIHWYEGRRAQMFLIGVLLVIFLLAAPLPLRKLFRGCRNNRPTLGRDLAAVACVINLIGLLGMAYSVFSADIFSWYHGLPRMVVAILYVPWLGMVLTLAAIGCTAISLRKPWTKIALAFHGITLAALLIFPLFCGYWHLLILPRWLPGS